MALAAKTAFSQFPDGHRLRFSVRRLPQALVLVQAIQQSHINPEQFILSIHYYFRISQVILNHKLTASQCGERNGSSGCI
ncbi:hypothetical protein FDX00_21150 [Citrobacter sp. wls617]|nr:hypothetical protein FDX00_21150 [Citrobacter sp. wls617]